MKLNKNILLPALISLFALFILMSPPDQAQSETYEVRPEIHARVDGYKSDVARIVDAYERLMDRYISMVDKDLNRTVGTLEAIEAKIDIMTLRLARIEKALGIELPDPSTEDPAPRPKFPTEK